MLETILVAIGTCLVLWFGVRLVLSGGLEKKSLAAAAEAVAFTTTLFACVVLHEFGHAFTEFGKLAPADALGRAAEMAIRYAQSDFPVLQDGQGVGLLSGRDLARWPADGVHRSVGDVMHRRFETIGRSEPIEAAFERLQQDPDKGLLVIDHGRLVGLVGVSEIAHRLRIRPAVAARRPDVMSVSPPTVRRTGTR